MSAYQRDARVILLGYHTFRERLLTRPWPLCCPRSLESNNLGKDGGVAVAEMLKVNKTLRSIK